MFIWTTRTILVFGKKSSWYGKTLPKKVVLGKVTFWDYREHELIHWRYILKSSPMLGSTPQGLLFLENQHFWILGACPFSEKCDFHEIASILTKWRRNKGQIPTKSACVPHVYEMCTECVRNLYEMCTKCVRNVYEICTKCVRNVHEQLQKVEKERIKTTIEPSMKNTKEKVLPEVSFCYQHWMSHGQVDIL